MGAATVTQLTANLGRIGAYCVCIINDDIYAKQVRRGTCWSRGRGDHEPPVKTGIDDCHEDAEFGPITQLPSTEGQPGEERVQRWS